MNLLLIRHACTDWAGKRLTGWMPGVYLNDKGHAQAAALAQRLADISLAAIYSSPLERALETAQPLAKAHGLTVQVCHGLSEIDHGDWAGRLIEELQQEELWSAMQLYPGGARFPGGESLRQAQARIVAELDLIRDAHAGRTVAVVSHADPIKMAVAHYLGLPLDLFHRLTIEPASLTALAFSRLGPRLLLLNYTGALPSFEIEGQV